MARKDRGTRLDALFRSAALLTDLVITYGALALAMVVRFDGLSLSNVRVLVVTGALYTILLFLLSEMEGLYYTRTSVNRSMHGYRAIRIILTITIIYMAIMFVFQLPSSHFVHSRIVIVVSFFIWIALYVVVRVLLLPHLLGWVLPVLGLGKIRLLLFGDDEHHRRITSLLSSSPIYRRIINLEFVPGPYPEDVSERMDHFYSVTRESGTPDLCVADDEVDFGDVARLAWKCRDNGLYLCFYSPIFLELKYYDPWLSMTERAAKVFFTPRMTRAAEALWRVVDVVGSLFLLVLLSPLLLVVTLLIKLGSRGPVLFLQERVGKARERFTFPKFRSMKSGNEEEHVEAHREYFRKYANGVAADENAEEGYKLRNRKRVTNVGRIIRKTSIDEFPQIFLVLTGRMSLAGPRPCIPYELEHYEDWQMLRFRVKPGLTGIWQVYGRSRLPFEAAQFMDFCYVMNRSVGQNVRLILQTVPVVLLGKGGV
ncbi:hypothetical protein GF402_06765 [Candidatus Fermentibacteria bacterium]|nr:hypothetical protein [Candidatus Fermentibacteria bacterium]